MSNPRALPREGSGYVPAYGRSGYSYKMERLPHQVNKLTVKTRKKSCARKFVL